MTADTLAAAIRSGSAPVVVDVRSEEEFTRGHIPGAVHVPFWLVPYRTDRIPALRSEPVVVYCGHGPRAWYAAQALRRQGFTRVSCLEGHWAAWSRAGLPQERP